MQINVKNYDKISHKILNICCFMYADSPKNRHTMYPQKNLWIYALIILSMFFKIESGSNARIENQTSFKALITSVNLALKKVISPITGLFSKKPISAEEQRKTIGFFTFMGITSRAGYINRLLNALYKQPPINISTPHNLDEQHNTKIPSKINFKAIIATTLRALKKISLPNAHGNLQKAWSLIQAHPKKSIFSIFAAGVVGIFFHGSYSTYNHINDTEEIRRIRQELQETRMRIQQARQAVTTISAQDAPKQAEYYALIRQGITLLRHLYEEETHRANLITDMAKKSIQILATERDRYKRESLNFAEQAKEWETEKTRLEKYYAYLQTNLQRLGRQYQEQIAATEQLESKKRRYEAQLSLLQQKSLPCSSLAKSDSVCAAAIPSLTKSDGPAGTASQAMKKSDTPAAISPIRIGSSYPAGTRPHTASDSKPDSQKPPITIKRDHSFGQSLKQADTEQEIHKIFEEFKQNLMGNPK